MSKTYEALRDLFAATGLDIDEHPEEGWVATDGFGPSGSWLLVGQAYDEQGVAAVYSVFPGKIPEERRDAVSQLLTRINYGLVLGNFELDLSDGEVRFKVSIPVGEAPSVDQLRPLTAVALGVADHYVSSIAAVIEGAEPAAAAANADAR